MNSIPQIQEFEQIISEIYTQYSTALRENYLHPYKQECDKLYSQTKKLNEMIMCIPEENRSPIKIKMNTHLFDLEPPHIQPLQTITQNYVDKLCHLKTGYSLLEHCAKETITLTLIQGYIKENGTTQPSPHLLFLMPSQYKTYIGYELEKMNQHQWQSIQHQLPTFEKAINRLPKTTTIFLVDNPHNFPFRHTVEHIMIQKYQELIGR